MRLKITIAALLGISLSALEITIVGTAAPIIVRELGGFESYGWIFSAYLLTSTVTMPLWGRSSDHWGRKRTFTVAMIIFILGSVLCGLAQDFTQLVLFRAVKGLGAGGLLPLAFTIVADVYDKSARTKIQGYISSVWGVSSLVGPFIGGAIAETLGWRWVFFMNVIPGLAALYLLKKHFVENHAGREPIKISFVSLASSVFFVGTLLLGMHFLQTQKIYAGVVAVLIALMSLAVFVKSERSAKYPLFPPQLFQHRVFTMTCVTGFLSSNILLGLASFIPLLYQSVLNYSPTLSGLVLFPFTFSWVLFSIFSTRLLLVLHYKRLLFLGFFLTVLGMSMFNFYFFRLNGTITVFCMVIMGAGMAFNYPVVMISTQYEVPKKLVGFATSAVFWIRHMGGTIGVTLMGLTFSHQFQKGLLTLPESGPHKALITALKQSPEIILRPETLAQIQQVPNIQHVLHTSLFWIFLIMFLFAILNLPGLLLFPKKIA